MDVALTDVLSCPRCGSRFGLVLLADEVADRRVLEGWLGCANCRERYRVSEGFADLRPQPASPLHAAGSGPAPTAAPASPEPATRLAALMGLAPGPRNFSLLVGDVARLAPAVAELVEGAEVVAVDPGAVAWREAAGVSRMAVGATLPFFNRSMRGVALSGKAGGALLEEGARVLHPMGRLVLQDVPGEVVERLAAAGLRVAAREGATAVAVWGGRASPGD